MKNWILEKFILMQHYLFILYSSFAFPLKTLKSQHINDSSHELVPLIDLLPPPPLVTTINKQLPSVPVGPHSTATVRLLIFAVVEGRASVAKVRRNCQTCGVNLSGTTKCGVTTPHSQLSVMQRKFCENENFTLKWIKVKQNRILLIIRPSYIATVTYFWVVVSLEFAPVRS